MLRRIVRASEIPRDPHAQADVMSRTCSAAGRPWPEASAIAAEHLLGDRMKS
jgi:hypothetical protein